MSVWKRVCESSGGAADACVHCNDAGNVAALASDAALLKAVVSACITHLNASAESVPAKSKQSSLSLLCMLARNDDARDCIFDSLSSLSGALEELLGQKEQARKDFGTQLGPFHTLVLTLLLRVQRYQLNAPDVMELVRGDCALAVEVVGCVCMQQPLEHAAVSACSRILFQMTTPAAHFTSEAGGGEPTEHALSAFSAVMLQLQRLFQVSDGVLKRVAGERALLLMFFVAPQNGRNASCSLKLSHVTALSSCNCQCDFAQWRQAEQDVAASCCGGHRALHRRHSERVQPQPRCWRHRATSAFARCVQACGKHAPTLPAALCAPRTAAQRHAQPAAASLSQPPRHYHL